MRFLLVLLLSTAVGCVVDVPDIEDEIFACTDNVDCAGGFYCEGGICVPDGGNGPGAGCMADSCEPETVCVDDPGQPGGFRCETCEVAGYCQGGGRGCVQMPMGISPAFQCVEGCELGHECDGPNGGFGLCVAVEDANGGTALACAPCPICDLPEVCVEALNTVRLEDATSCGTPDFVSIWIEPGSLTLTVGSSDEVRAIAQDGSDNTYDVTPGVDWSSDDTSIANVDANGAIFANNVGTTQIRASFDGLFTQMTIDVIGVSGVIDYQIVNIEAPASGRVGDSFSGSFQVENMGDADGTSTFEAEVWLSLDPSWQASDLMVTNPPAQLSPLNAYEQTGLIFFNGTWPTDAGDWYFIFRLVNTLDDTPGNDLLTVGPLTVDLGGGFLMAISADRSVYWSDDGSSGTWNSAFPGFTSTGTAITTDGNGRWLAVGMSGQAFYSDDSWNWTAATLSGSAVGPLWSATHCGGRWVIGGAMVSPEVVQYYSDDAETFLMGMGAPSFERRAIACDPVNLEWVAVGGSGRSASSDNGGQDWMLQAQLPVSSATHYGLATAGGSWVAVGSFGTIAQSWDPFSGGNWDDKSGLVTNDLWAVATDGFGTFVAVGDNGQVAQSTDDGQNWNMGGSVSGASLRSAAWEPVSGRFVVGDTGGNVYFSQDGGSSWGPAIATGSTAAINGIAAGQP